MKLKTLLQYIPISRSTFFGAGLIVACNAFASAGSSEPVSDGSASLESGTLDSGAFELVMITAGDQLRSISFALGGGPNVEISNGYIDANGADGVFSEIDNHGEMALDPGQDVVGSFSQVIVFGESGMD